MKQSKHFALILIIVVSVITVAFLVTAWILSNNAKTNIRSTVEEQFAELELEVAEGAANVLEDKMSSIIDELLIIAQFQDVNDGNAESCNVLLEEVSKNMEFIGLGLHRTKKDGTLHCGTEIPEFKRIEDHTNIDHVHSNESDPFISYGSTIKDEEGEILEFIFNIDVPVYNEDGDFDGTLGVFFNSNDLHDQFLADANITEGGYFIIVDDNGDMLFHPNEGSSGKNVVERASVGAYDDFVGLEELLMAAKDGLSGHGRYFYNDIWKVAAYHPANLEENRHWGVILTTPVDEAEAYIIPIASRLEYQIKAIAGFAALLILIAIVFAWRWTKSLKSQVQEKTIELTQSEKKLSENVENLENLNENMSKNEKELKDKKQRLEEVNKSMTGRELKMIELKKEIDKLKKKGE
jgi:hypothetical protein